MRILARLAVASIAFLGCGESVTTPVLPSPPEGLVAAVTPSRQIQLSWQQRPENENVAAYSVYRDGLLIGETSNVSMTDSLAPQSRIHEYSVASRSADGVTSERSPGVSIFAPDAIAPRVVSVSPSDNSLNVSPLTLIQIRFDEAMDSASFTPASFTVKDALSNTTFAGSIAYDRTTRTAAWSPLQPLPAERRVAVTVSGVKDTSGLAIAQPLSFSFTIRETTSPSVVSVSPANGSVVPVGIRPTVKFSERMGNLGGVQWFDSAGTLFAVGGIQDTLTNTVTLTPTKRVRSFVPYTVRIDERTTDLSGNPVRDTLSFTFQYDEWVLPAVATVTPAPGASDVPLSTVIVVDLASPTQLYNDYEIRFNVRKTGSSSTLPAFWIVPNSGTRITLTPPTLDPNTSYTVVFYHFFTDSKGIRHELEKIWSFTTASQ